MLSWIGFKGCHPKSHAGLTENERVDELPSQGTLRRPLWTANKLLLTMHKEKQKENHGLDLHIFWG